VRAYTVTPVSGRGYSREEYGVGLDKITWVVVDEETRSGVPEAPM